MFGFFKSKVSPSEFGQAVLHVGKDFLMLDAGHSLVLRFEDFFDRQASESSPSFLERHGLAMPLQKLYFRLYTHCAMQANFSQFDAAIAREMTRGAMSLFTFDIEGYDFDATYMTLDSAYRGQHLFSPAVEPLTNAEAKLKFLPNPYAGVVNAKFLIEDFVLPYMSNSPAFIDDFWGYSSAVSSAVGTACRAMDQVSKSFKVCC
jgi:hypothetical protein